MSYLDNVYYTPERCGLGLVQMLDEEGLSYEFNMLGVWQHADSGRLFWAQSAGCSCPSPFDEFEFTSPDDNNFEEITPASLQSFIHQVDQFPAEYSQRRHLITVVKTLLGGRP